MATSGTTTFDANRDQIITSALRKVQAIAEGETASPEQINNGTFVLNTLIKAFHADGMPLWAIEDRAIPCSAFTNGVLTIGVGQALDIPAPLKVINAFNRDLNTYTPTGGYVDIPMILLTHDDYNWLSAKQNTGTPIQYWYEPMNQYGRLHLWPIPDSYAVANREIHITYQRPFEDAGNSANTLDFPQCWNDALIMALAVRLAPEYGLPPNDRQILRQEAKDAKDYALSFGTEEGSLRIAPDWSRMGMK